MRENKITKQVEEINGYYADDGTWFRDKEQCQKYEESAKMVAFKMVQDKLMKKITVYDLLNEGSEEEDVEIYNVDTTETAGMINRYISLATYDKQVPIKTDMVGKIILVHWSYDKDWCECLGTIDDYLAKIKAGYEEMMAQE